VRSSSVPVVHAHGLTLEEVGYPPDDELAARAAQTMARRRPEEVTG
jgi:tRNA pseudouridine38-40 synthase